jgi:hypothetical protein
VDKFFIKQYKLIRIDGVDIDLQMFTTRDACEVCDEMLMEKWYNYVYDLMELI